mgnify:CR=1 FL=1
MKPRKKFAGKLESGDKAIDLYGMVSVLWKAVQELSDKVDSLQQKQEV